MKLKFEFPREFIEKIEGKVIYALPFDLGFDGVEQEGVLVVTEQILYKFNNKEIVREIPLEKLEDFETKQLVGSCVLSAKVDGEEELLCAFKPKWFKRFAEMSKLLNYYHKSSEHITYDEAVDEYICQKCGYPLQEGSSTCFRCQNKVEVLKKIMKLGLPYKKIFGITVLLTLAMEMVWIVNPYIMRIIIDDYITVKNRDVAGLLGLLGIYLSMFILVTLLERTLMKCTNILSNNISKGLRTKVFEKVQQLSLGAVSQRTPGELMNRINSDTQKIQDLIVNYGRDAINRIFSVIILGTLLFWMDYRMALVILVPLPIVLYWIDHMQKKMRLRYWKQWRKHERASSALHDTLSGISVVKSYGNEKLEVEKYTKNVDQLKDAMIDAESTWAKVYPYIGYLMTFGEFMVLWIGGQLVLEEKMALGQLIQYTTYVGMIYVPLRWSIQLPKILADVMISAGKVFELLEEECDMKDKENAIETALVGDVAFEEVGFGYKVYEPVVRDISFKVEAGEMIGIVGHSGVGKSTLINLLMRLYDVTDGRITIDGEDIRNYSQKTLRSQIGVVLQENFLFKGSVMDNIRYSKPEATLEEIIEAAKVANAHEFIIRLPDAYHTVIGEKGHTLSGGERQRIAIARAVLHNPRILILDEATSALDTETEKKIQEALERLSEGKTTFAIAHRLSTLQKANRLLVLDQGTFAEMGTHQELMQKKGIYYDLVKAQRKSNKMKELEQPQRRGPRRKG